MIHHGSRTDVGRRRPRNEDTILAAAGLFVVCDGMGGHQAGDVASRLAVDAIASFIERSTSEAIAVWPYGFDPALSHDANRLQTAIKLANHAVFTRGESCDEYAGMGTTVAALLMTDEARFTYAHVGDSRIYLISAGRMAQLTQDDSLANSVWVDAVGGATAVRNILTKAIGARAEVEFEVTERDLLAGDIVLLCSDGLTNMLADATILDIVIGNVGHLDKACEALVARANDQGGRDNISVILLRSMPAGSDVLPNG